MASKTYSTSLNNETGDGINILSFDSGGPGTYSQLLLVKEYTSRISLNLGISEEDVYPADYFDLMGGVGFGGRLMKSLATDCEIVAKELSTRLFTVDAYLRLNVERGMEDVSMTDWNSVGDIESHTSVYIESAVVEEALENSLDRIQSKMGSITLGQLSHSSSIKVSAKEVPAVSPYYVLTKAPWDLMVHHLISSPYSHQRIFPITGMGGCGKTQLVSYFLREHRALYKRAVFVDASSKSSIQSDLQTWVRSLGDGHERDVWEDGLRILASGHGNEQMALILDNADDPGLNLVPFLPQNINLTIIITSRNHALGNLSTTFHLELAEMEDDEALLTLVQAARRDLPLPLDEERCARKLADELGCLAVALVQAGRYCSQLSSSVKGVFRPYTFAQYLPLFYSHRSELMRKAEPSSLHNYQRGAYTTLDLSYQATPQKARVFLHFVSFFHHTDIPLEALATAAENSFQDVDVAYSPRPEEHKQVITALKDALCTNGKWNQPQVHETIHTLRSFSLLSVTSVDDSVFLQMHPLVQSWSRDRAASDLQLYAGMAVQVLTSCCGRKANFRIYRYILPHILDMVARDTLILHINDQIADGRILHWEGNYDKAIMLFGAALEAMRHSDGARINDELTVMEWLGAVYSDAGKAGEAERLDVEVLEQRRRILGPEHPDTVRAMASLAVTYQLQGRWLDAEQLKVDVLEWRRRVQGIDYPETIKAAANLVATYHSQGRWEEAESLEVEVLEQRQRLMGLEHPETIQAAANLASTCRSQGRWHEAEILELDVLRKRQRILGIDHPDTLLARANLAATYSLQSQWEDEVQTLRPAVEANLRFRGQDHPDTQAWLWGLAEASERLGQNKESQEMRRLLL